MEIKYIQHVRQIALKKRISVILCLVIGWQSLLSQSFGSQEESSPVKIVHEFLYEKESRVTLDDIVNSILYGNNLDEMTEAAYDLLGYGRKNNLPTESVYGSTLLGVCYLYGAEMDSSLFYLNHSIALDSSFEEKKRAELDRIMAITWNNLGLCHINLALDYYKAASYFIKALERIERDRDPQRYISILCNLSIVHYFRKDPSGIEYARECYDFASKREMAPFMANYGMTLMEYTCGNYAVAAIYAQRLIEILSSEKERYYDRDIIAAYTIYGKILMEMGKDSEAERAFKKAISVPVDPNNAADYSGAWLSYGDFHLKKHRYDEALKILMRGIELGRDRGNEVHLVDLYNNVSLIYETMGKADSALKYHKIHHAISDSISDVSKEFALSEVKAKYRIEQYENKIKEYEISSLKKAKRTQLVGLVFIIIIGGTSSLWFYSRKKSLYYEKLVRQYNQNISLNREIKKISSDRANESKYSTSSLSESKGNDLFSRIRALMEEEKIYRDATLSIDTLAAKLNTNRSYISRSINEYTGTNFNKYCNRYRIAEAVEILSDPSNSALLKEVGMNVGFNSASTFYKAFTEETGVSPSVYKKKIVHIVKSDDSENMQ